MSNFYLKDLPKLLKENNTNYLTNYLDNGSHKTRFFSDIYRDVCKTIKLLDADILKSRNNMKAVIMGETSYEWLLIALACMFKGIEVIALPESLSEEETSCSLNGISFSLAFVTKGKMSLPSFDKVKTIELEKVSELIGKFDFEENDFSSFCNSIIAFTSGSTSGKKLKSFRINLDSTSKFISNFISLFKIGHDDMWTVCHSFSHIVHLEYVLGGLGWGYNITLTNVFNLLINAQQINPSILVTVPNIYQQIANQIQQLFPTEGKRLEELEELLNQPLTDKDGKNNSFELIPEAKKVIGNRIKMMLIGAAPSSLELQSFLIKVGMPLFEGYGMSELNMISCNTPKSRTLGTVGKIWPGIKVKIDENEVLLAKSECIRTTQYLNVTKDENNKTFSDGWVSTGDLAIINDDFLTIIGRKKEIIITSGGYNINPAPIEKKLSNVSNIGHTLIFGDNKPFLIVLFAPKINEDLPSYSILRDYLDKMNRSLSKEEKILELIRLPISFSIENGLLTRSNKPRRLVIFQRFNDLINSCYQYNLKGT